MNSANNQLVTKVEIGVSCKNLCGMDLLSKSDPMAVLYMQSGNAFSEIGRSEVIQNNHNPVFAKRFLVDYHFETRQTLKVEIYDSDSASCSLNAHDFLGRLEFNLGQLVSRQTMEAALTGGKDAAGQLVVLSAAEMDSGCKEVLTLQLAGNKLDKKDTFGKSDPLLEFYRCNSATPLAADSRTARHAFTLVHRTKPVMNTLNPTWPPIVLPLGQLCFGDHDRLIKVVCADWDSDGSQDLIGDLFTSVAELKSHRHQQANFKLINEKKSVKKKNYDNSGTITVNKFQIHTEHSFLDYISTGTDLNFTVAIDFTGSNGDPRHPSSLHFIPPGGPMGVQQANQYEFALSAVGSIIQDYDSDRQFPGLGFGAKIPPTGQISHCFPLSFQPQNPFCFGVEGLVAAYRAAVTQVALYGPTNFAPTIRHVQGFGRAIQDGSKYFVLLIITDGIITDMDTTTEAIIDCSHLPVSIIIIGVGKEDFSAMNTLDCDNGRLAVRNKVAARDIVQFVALRDYVRQGQLDQVALSAAVLKELPGQVTQWMGARGISPLPRRQAVPPPSIAMGDNQKPPYPPQSAGAPPYPPQSAGAPPYPPQSSGAPPYPPQSAGAPYPPPSGAP